MIRGEIRNSRARWAWRSARAAARVLAGAAVAAVGGLAVCLAAAGVPALAAQHPGGTAASQTRAGATGQHPVTGGASPGGPWARIAAGQDHTCGIRAGGALWCWGGNGSGQLGLGSYTDQDQPRQVTTPAAGGWASITAGSIHTCATRSDGTLWCWGWGYHGQLGIGNHKGECHPQQVTIPAAGGWASISAGEYAHTCATRTDGTLWCWGSNDSGELGIGGDTDQEVPRQVTTPAAGGWGGVTGGAAHTCATRTEGTLWCWGWNSDGQLGLGNHTDQDRPRQVTGFMQPAARPRARQ